MSRKIRPYLLIALVVLFTISLAALLTKSRFGGTAEAKPETVREGTATPTSSGMVATSTNPTAVGSTTATVATAPPGSSIYVAKKGENLPGLVHRYLPKTQYLTGSELEQAIRQANPPMKTIWLKEGQNVVIPGMLPADFAEKSIPRTKDFEVRAIYLTGTMAGSAKGLDIIREWRRVGGNSVVFDIKDSDGFVNVPFQHPLSNDKYIPIRNLPKFIHFLHSQGMHAIARIAIFRDEYLVQQHPELAVKSRRSGQAWRENGKLVWTDPSNAKVQEFNIALAKFAAESGVDEVQFDYVRFPAEGDQKDAQFAFQSTHPNWQRADVIADFLKSAHSALKPLNVLFSLDVFGVMAWQRNVDLAHTGQDIPRMAEHCDVLSPMIYPSHFFGMDGYAWPGDAPEHFIGSSMDRFKAITKDSGVVLRPWLQAFGWKTKTYSPEYIKVQVAVSHQKGGIGFLFWNARNDYSKPLAAMPDMKAAAAKYFRADTPSGTSAQQGPVPGGGSASK